MNPVEALSGTALLWSPVIYGLMEAAKKAGWGGSTTQSSTAAVLLALILGPFLTLGWWIGNAEGAFTVKAGTEALYTGLIGSLIAMGVYTGAKKLGVTGQQ